MNGGRERENRWMKEEGGKEGERGMEEGGREREGERSKGREGRKGKEGGREREGGIKIPEVTLGCLLALVSSHSETELFRMR